MNVSNIYTPGSVVLLTSRGCHVSPGRWLHLLLGKRPHPTLLVCKALLGFSWCCVNVKWHKSKFLHVTQLCLKTKSPCACKHASKSLLKKRKKSSNAREKEHPQLSVPGCANTQGRRHRVAPEQDPPEQCCQHYICLRRLTGAASPEMLPPIFPFQVDPL